MPAASSGYPHAPPATPSPADAWGPYLVRLFFGAGLVGVVLYLGPVAWRLGQRPPSGRPAARERGAPARSTVTPRQDSVVEAGAELGEGVGPLPAAPPGPGEEERPLDTGRLGRADAPRQLPDGLPPDDVFEQRLRSDEESLFAQLHALPEVRLMSDGDVRAARRKEQEAEEQLVAVARANREDARVQADAANARVDAIHSEMNGNRLDPALLSAERQALRAAREAQRAFMEANSASILAASRGSQERERVGYDCTVRLHRTMRRAAVQAGLALRSGPDCQLNPTTAAQVAKLSKELRDMGFVSIPGVLAVRLPGGVEVLRPPGGGLIIRGATGVVINGAGVSVGGQRIPSSDGADDPTPGTDNADKTTKEFQAWCDQHRLEGMSGTVPTLAQMLQSEDEAKRLLLVRELRRIPSAAATTQLAVRAVVDLSPAVRRAALAGLGRRPWGQYASVLLRGLRYPRPPVADHAAAALRKLGPPEAIAPLVELLDLPSPSAPVLDPRTNQYAVREVVRVNHLRNCLLCHAPSANKDDGLVRGPVPTPGEELPVGYYESAGGHFVRADITVLRQDFSVNLPAEEAGPWPRRQRYDFVTRLRTLSPGQAAELGASSADYPQRDAVLYALRGLTGLDGGASSARWRDLLGPLAERPGGEKKRPALEAITVSLADADRRR